MIQPKLQAAKELILAKDYAAARAILASMPENLTAVRWLAQLDRIMSPKPAPMPTRRRDDNVKRGIDWTMIVTLIVMVAIICGIVFAIYRENQQSSLRAAEYTCGFIFEPHTTDWQKCVEERK